MAKQAAQEQITQSIALAGAKGSQRIITYAMVDKDSYVSFYVPEWFVVLVGAAEKMKAGTIIAGAKPWVAKEPTKEPQTADENLPVTTGTGTNKRIVRKKLGNASKSPINSTTSFIGKGVTLFLKPDSVLKRGTKSYKTKLLRVHKKMNDYACKYYLQQLGLKDKLNGFSSGKLFYPLDDADVQIAELGQLRDNDGTATAP